MTKQDIYQNGLPFLKMHGLGNDFVIIDARDVESPINSRQSYEIKLLTSSGHFGI